jgi:hypothetical protein
MPAAPNDQNIRTVLQKIRTVLQKAAADPAFHMLLLNNREAALKDFPLSDAERNMLLSATATQLEKMVEQARRKPESQRSLGVTAGVGIAAALVAAGIFMPTLGHSREAAYESICQDTLRRLARMEATYREQHGCYSPLDSLLKATSADDLVGQLAGPGFPYTIKLRVEGDSFTATARHKTRPDTRRAWQVGPDGQVKPLE